MLRFLLALGISGLSPSAQAADLATWVSNRPEPSGLPDHAVPYRFSSQLFGEIEKLARERPGVVTVESIGASEGGEPIWAFHVAVPGSEPSHRALVFGGIHALEWVSTEVATDLLLELIEAPPHDTRVTVIPLLNPDGRIKVENDLLGEKNLYRRGNLANVDLNRDFEVNRDSKAIWQAIIPGYYAHSEAPLSQPESQALDALLERERYDRAASLHAFGGYLYFPWAGRFERPEHWGEHLALGRQMEAAQGAHAYRPRQLARWGFFFRAQGTELDHIYGKYGTLAFLIELTRSGIDPLHSRSLKTFFRWYNPKNARRHRAKGLAAVRSLVRHWDEPEGSREK